MFQPMLYGLGKSHIHRMHIRSFEQINYSTILPCLFPDQSMLDEIEKNINDDMKRIVTWLKQLK